MDKKVQHEALVQLEQPLVKVPLEQLQRSFRNTRKHLERGEWSTSLAAIHDLATGTDAILANKATAAETLQTCIARLQGLKRKLKEGQEEDKAYARKLKLRLEHMQDLYKASSTEDEVYARWTQTRLSRLLVDYVLRIGYHRTAEALIQKSQLKDLTDADLFYTAKKIQDSLRNGRSCTECLNWCNENKSNLRKVKSTLEFSLRVQEFVELVRKRLLIDAIQYARKYLAPWAETHLEEIQKVMALLAFPPDTQCLPYKKYFSEDRWDRLVEQFHQDNYTLNSLTSQPILAICMQAGLMALKTPYCHQTNNKNVNCPVCNESFGALAERLPYSQRLNSCVVCRISGAIMDEDNAPMVLPNGNVYSLKALEEMAKHNGKGRIVDPRTGEVFQLSDSKKAFLA